MFELQKDSGKVRNEAVGLSRDDKIHLGQYERQQNFLRTRVNAVVGMFDVGLYVRGRAGCGKTHTIEATLRERCSRWTKINGHVTAIGLFEALNSFREPGDVVLIDDVHRLFRDPVALQMLQAALDGEPGMPRRITRVVSSKDNGLREIKFAGGLIFISNLPLGKDEISASIASRLRCIAFDPADEVMEAVVRDMALRANEPRIEPAERMQVIDFLIGECRAGGISLDLRMVRKAFVDWLVCEFGDSHGIGWKDLVRDGLDAFRIEAVEPPMDLHAIAKEVNVLPTRQERFAAWKARTGGMSQATFYRYRPKKNAS